MSAALTAIAALGLTACNPVKATEQRRVSFCTTGAPAFWVVPEDVTAATFWLFGAQGGVGSTNPMMSAPGGDGGRGGLTVATFAVVPGEIFQVNVGCKGGSPSGMTSGAGGFNGGGAGGSAGGGGGGGATDIRRGGAGPEHRILVAAGGGGGGGGGDDAPPAGTGGTGGTGGHPEGAGGAGSQPGLGGQQASGGAGGGPGGQAGVPGAGGSAGGRGGGGGGGIYGGGGAGEGSNGSPGGGGGGGSSSGPAGTVFANDVQPDDGLVVIVYVACDPLSVDLPGSYCVK